jgi:hypothetical protein
LKQEATSGYPVSLIQTRNTLALRFNRAKHSPLKVNVPD